MIPDDVRPLIQSLIERSKRREVEWHASSAAGHAPGNYVVLFPNSSLVIGEEEDGKIEGQILNSRGDVALTFWGFERGAGDDYIVLSDLLEAARRKVLRADEALAEMRSVLESAPRVGEAPKARPVSPADDDEEVPF